MSLDKPLDPADLLTKPVRSFRRIITIGFTAVIIGVGLAMGAMFSKRQEGDGVLSRFKLKNPFGRSTSK